MLQRLTRLLPPIHRQLLLRGKPDMLQQAIQDATNVEYALNFDAGLENTQDINIVKHKTKEEANEVKTPQKVQDSLDQIIRRLESLETAQTQAQMQLQRSLTRSQYRQRNPPSRDVDRRCWLCGELGHMKRSCPLNYKGPVAPVGSWPRQ